MHNNIIRNSSSLEFVGRRQQRQTNLTSACSTFMKEYKAVQAN